MADAPIPHRGRTALVTGGSRGIGRAIALELADGGATVGVNFRRDAEAARGLVDRIRATGGTSVALQADLGLPGEADRLAADALSAVGPVDILVLNAGRASRGHPVAATEAAELAEVVTGHALSAHQLVRRLLPGMREATRADVLAISSSEVSQMRPNGGPYNMAKAALEALALTLAHEEAANGIRVNIVAPGLVVTEMGSRLVRAKLGVDDIEDLDADQPFGRLVRPGDIAAMVSFLVSEAAGMITGQRIVVDGGADASPTG